MPRPCKRRRICGLPPCGRFGPLDGNGAGARITMTVDEYEAIRLIDLEGLTQEACAGRMNVARTTAQAIYNSARLKLAQFLAYECELRIEGGEYVVCEARERGCSHCQNCEYERRYPPKEEGNMRIAVTYENESGQVFQHFGHSEYFKLYDVEDGAVHAAMVVNTEGSGHGALADLLRRYHVDALICGGIGGGARQALEAAGIALYGGVFGDADQVVQDFLSGKLNYNPDVRCSHHDSAHGGEHTCGQHEEGHTCGQHGCGQHGCH